MSDKSLGTLIKEYRKTIKMSQSELALNICTQPLISAIENNKYIPNGIILIKIFNKLGIDPNELTLNDNFEISQNVNVNKKMVRLCNDHKYKELYYLLIKDDTINSISNDIQEQAYYYYLAIAILQFKNNYNDAILNFKLSLTLKNNTKDSNLLERLSEASIAYVYSLKGNTNLSNININKAVEKISEFDFVPDQLIIFYLAALSSYNIKDYLSTIRFINQLIGTATKNDSPYMLANTYYLLSVVASKTENFELFKSAKNRENVIHDLFGEKIFKNI